MKNGTSFMKDVPFLVDEKYVESYNKRKNAEKVFL